MNNPTTGPKLPDPHDHLWNKKAPKTQDDDGEWSSYGMCSNCGAIENTDESIKDCPKSL